MSKSLSNWLSELEASKPINSSLETMRLDLEKASVIADSLSLKQFKCPVVTIAGTNGKGSCVAVLEAVLLAAGYRVAALTSPHLLKFNERLRISGREISDAELCEAFSLVDKISKEKGCTLTYYRFIHLSLLWLCQQYSLDICLLEIGLGGRFDSVNLVNSDIAVVTSIDLDHCTILGGTRDAIAVEKASILRESCPLVCGDPSPPKIIESLVKEKSGSLLQYEQDFTIKELDKYWNWYGPKRTHEYLPKPKVLLQNAATALMVIDLLAPSFPVKHHQLTEGLVNSRARARCELLEGSPAVLIDVAHNVASVTSLRKKIKNTACSGKRRAVFGMMTDKDIQGVINILQDDIDCWYVADMPDFRAEKSIDIRQNLDALSCDCQSFSSPEQAYQQARSEAKADDLLVVFGSFKMVASVLKYHQEYEGCIA